MDSVPTTMMTIRNMKIKKIDKLLTLVLEPVSVWGKLQKTA